MNASTGVTAGVRSSSGGGSSAPTLEDANPLAEICAGWCVGQGAILAGELRKRSAWKHVFNLRFFVLLTDELVWFRTKRCEDLTSTRGRFEERRRGAAERHSLPIDSTLSVSVSVNTLHITSGSRTVIISAPSEAILGAWRDALERLAGEARVAARTARLLVRERAEIAASSLAEHLHMGSRNFWSRRLGKLSFGCSHLVAPGRTGLGRLVRGSGAKKEEALLTLTTLPEGSPLAESEAHRAAFRAIMGCLGREGGHPFLLPPIHADIIEPADDPHRAAASPRLKRLAVFRRYLPCGSLRDAVHRVYEPRAEHSHKYSTGQAEQTAAADLLAAADLSTAGGCSGGGSGGGGVVAAGSGVGRGGAGAVPLPAVRVAQCGRQVLEALRFLSGAGLPCTHVHPGNVLAEPLPGGTFVLRIADAVELALCGLPSYGETRLARPRPDPASVADFAIGREVLAFGHLLFELVSGLELDEKQLDTWEEARAARRRVAGGGAPGPAVVWDILERIFLPAAGVGRGPALLELSASPFFSVELPLAAACSDARPPSFGGDAAALLEACHAHWGGDTLRVPPRAPAAGPAAAAETPTDDLRLPSGAIDGRTPDEAAAAGAAPRRPSRRSRDGGHGRHGGGASAEADARPRGKRAGAKPGAPSTFTFACGEPWGLTWRGSRSGEKQRLTVLAVAEGGAASELGVPIGGRLRAVNGEPTSERTEAAIHQMLEAAAASGARSVRLKIAPPRQPAPSGAGAERAAAAAAAEEAAGPEEAEAAAAASEDEDAIGPEEERAHDASVDRVDWREMMRDSLTSLDGEEDGESPAAVRASF